MEVNYVDVKKVSTVNITDEAQSIDRLVATRTVFVNNYVTIKATAGRCVRFLGIGQRIIGRQGGHPCCDWF